MINLNISIDKIKEHFKYYVIGTTISIIFILFSFSVFSYINDDITPRSYINDVPIYTLPRSMKNKGANMDGLDAKIEILFRNQKSEIRNKVEFVESNSFRINPFLPKK